LGLSATKKNYREPTFNVHQLLSLTSYSIRSITDLIVVFK